IPTSRNNPDIPLTKGMISMKLALGLLLACLPAAVMFGAEDFLIPGDNLVVDGLPPIPLSLVDECDRYAEFRRAVFADWHPTERKLLIGTRFANATQLHLVAAPGGARKQLTFFDEPVGGASFQPGGGAYIVFSRDTGGAEFYQQYRLDLEGRRVSLLT